MNLALVLLCLVLTDRDVYFQAAAPLVRYMTKGNRRDFIEFLLADINNLKKRVLILQLRKRFLAMQKKLAQVQKDKQSIEMRSREAGAL